MGTCCAVDPREAKLLASISEGLVFHRSGPLPRLSREWKARDWLGMAAVRLGFGRGRYRIPAGLYALGNPTPDSPVLVTANYKLTVDVVRRACAGLDAFVLVLDTRGINVWCAAGKGTFGTAELVRRVVATKLAQAVDHRNLILPQLGATGVAARAVREQSGFSVKWGPVRIRNVRQYLEAGMRATEDMRAVTFSLRERLAVTPIEVTQSWKVLLPSMAVAGLLALVKTAAAWPGFLAAALSIFFVLAAAVAAGALLFPALLPLLPGRAFSVKGALLGALAGAGLGLVLGLRPEQFTWAVLLAAPVTAFSALNFTGATPFASVSGVKREISRGVPVIALSFVAGCIFTVIF